jgi:hypothetical protein
VNATQINSYCFGIEIAEKPSKKNEPKLAAELKTADY